MNNRVAVVAGGTGGHIFPGLCVARELTRRGLTVRWLGCDRPLVKRLVSDEFELFQLPSEAFRGRGLLGKLRSVVGLLRSTVVAYRWLRAYRPGVLLAMGGYVAAPGILAAKLAGVPVVMHEQNAVAGMTNRFCARFASRVLAGFAGAFPAGLSVQTVGNPVRADLLTERLPLDYFERRCQQGDTTLRVLILGGSQGAVPVNDLLLAALTEAGVAERESMTIRHQAGIDDCERVMAAYELLGVSAEVMGFVDDMAAAYVWADVVIARAGALTVSELAVAGVPSLLIPYPYAVDDHQTKNAGYLAAAGAAEIFNQADLDAKTMWSRLWSFYQEPDQLQQMRAAAQQLGCPQAAGMVADVCVSFLSDASELLGERR